MNYLRLGVGTEGMFNTIFETGATGMGWKTVMVCAGVAILLGLVVAFTHMKTSRTSKGFLVTLAVMPLLVMAVMMMINGSLGTSIAILGAFSLIRFRSVDGKAKELLSVFFTMMIGLALGMGHVLFAALVTAVGVLAIFLFSWTPILEPNKRERTLSVVIPEDLDYDEVFDEIFGKYVTKARLVQTRTVDMGSLYRLTYEVTMKRGAKEKEFLDAIRVKNCNLKVTLSQPIGEEEL